MSLNAPIIVDGDTKYTFATGVVRGMWYKRPGKAEFYRLIDVDSAEVGKLLEEYGYFDADVDAEKAITDEWTKTISLVESLSHDPEITRLLRLFTDFTNAAAAVKANIFEYDYAPLHIPGGFASTEDLIAVASGNEKHCTVPAEVAESIHVAIDAYSVAKLPIIIDLAADHFFGKFYTSQMIGSGREFLAEYVRRWADMKNISAYLRMRVAGLPNEHFEQFFIENGHIPHSQFQAFELQELDGIPARLVFSYYGKPLADVVSKLVHEDDFGPLSKYSYELLETFLRQNIYISYGLEVLLAYAFLVWREIRAVGSILRMKNANIDRDRITERIMYDDL